MWPGENHLGPFGAEKFFADKIREDLPGEELRQPGVVDPGDLVEGARLVHSALGHQEMQMRVEIDPVVLEEYPQHPEDGEDDLRVGNIRPWRENGLKKRPRTPEVSAPLWKKGKGFGSEGRIWQKKVTRSCRPAEEKANGRGMGLYCRDLLKGKKELTPDQVIKMKINGI